MRKSKKGKGPGKKPASGKGTTFCDHNVAAANPNTTQYEPTEASPINQHKQMAGVS